MSTTDSSSSAGHVETDHTLEATQRAQAMLAKMPDPSDWEIWVGGTNDLDYKLLYYGGNQTIMVSEGDIGERRVRFDPMVDSALRFAMSIKFSPVNAPDKFIPVAVQKGIDIMRMIDA